MTTRITQEDTAADIELRENLDHNPPKNFVMIAGAGSGKTTSLIKALAHLAKNKGPDFRRRKQQVACITYTEVAVQEIWADVGNDPLFHVSTIHSFLWTIIRSFQADLKVWVDGKLNEKILEAQDRIAKPTTRQKTKDSLSNKIQRYQEQRRIVSETTKFIYSTGSDYSQGVLGHSDILEIGAQWIDTKPLLQRVIANRYPYVFVDESQDTVQPVVEALISVAKSIGNGFCLGFFGDPMQKIYLSGENQDLLQPGWEDIKKHENFRCPTSVLVLINKIRAEADGLEQTRGRKIRVDEEWVSVEGSARIFIFLADEHRTERLDQVRNWSAVKNNDEVWKSTRGVKSLILVHRMAATRLGFPNLYAALNDKAPSSFKTGVTDGTIWVVRPFLAVVLPLVMAVQQGNEFDVISILRAHCPLLIRKKLLSQNVSELLKQLQEHVTHLVQLLDSDSEAKIGDLLQFIRENELFELDDRFSPFLQAPDETPDSIDIEDEDEEGNGANSIRAFFDCKAVELWGYRQYIEDLSPFATQQGVKGAEFDRVMVILDEEENSNKLFSYEKYFGLVPPSKTDIDNAAQGKETVIDRTRRLFYVCCSRARQDLAVIFFVEDVAKAREAIEAKNYFRREDIYELADIEGALNHRSLISKFR